MLDELVKNLVLVKQDFAKNYTGSAHIQEVIPTSGSEQFPIDKNHLEMLHDFAQKNPIYFNSFEQNHEEFLNDFYLYEIVQRQK